MVKCVANVDTEQPIFEDEKYDTKSELFFQGEFLGFGSTSKAPAVAGAFGLTEKEPDWPT